MHLGKLLRRITRRCLLRPVLHGRRESDRPPTEARFRKRYERPTAFTNYLPWLDYDPDSRSFLLDDGRSVGALFELHPPATEARPRQWLADFRDKVQAVLTGSLPEADDPWILQMFVQDEARLDWLVDEIEAYCRPPNLNTPFTRHWLEVLREHLVDVSRPGGLYVDQLVTGNPWQGKRRRVRAALFRRRPAAGALQFGDLDAVTELNDVAARFAEGLRGTGIGLTRMDGKAFYEWLFRWFNPNPSMTEGDVEALLKLAPWPGDDIAERPFGYDLSEALMLGLPRYHPDKGVWWFDELPHRAITVQSLQQPPGVGQLLVERRVGERIFSVFDKMPEHTILTMTLTLQPQDQIREHLKRIERAAIGDYAEAQLAGEDAKAAQVKIVKGDKLYPLQTVVYVRGNHEADLQSKANQVQALMLANGLKPISQVQDLCVLDTYLKSLPLAYEHRFDCRRARRSRLTFSGHIANLAPVYGRSTGTGNPGLLFFNRGGEPLTFDPLNLHDRKKNAHLLLVGPTGSGKSATLVYLILQMLALYRPRIFLVEAGDSFGLLGQYLKTQGLTVNQVAITPAADVSLPPFADALKLLELNRLNLTLESAHDLDDDPSNDYDEDDDDGQRDLLGELEITARLMITGGEAREDNRLSRSDRLIIREALIGAARTAKEAGRRQVLPEDVVQALRARRESAERRRERIQDMADALALFTTPGSFEARLFNRPGRPWPNVDVTLVDLGLLAREGYEDKLTVAYIGLMNHINALVEREQHDQRPTLVITDEGHIITTNPLLAPYVVKITKMWRKLGAWFWIATQNLEDFPDASRRMLNMLEWWLCLVMPKDEINQIARFRDLTEEQVALLLAARKSPGQYVEGVVLTDHLTALFRNVPPPIALALAMTEKDEKAERAAIMQAQRCGELEAALAVAGCIAAGRRNS